MPKWPFHPFVELCAFCILFRVKEPGGTAANMQGMWRDVCFVFAVVVVVVVVVRVEGKKKKK
jgi:hypothetical protein